MVHASSNLLAGVCTGTVADIHESSPKSVGPLHRVLLRLADRNPSVCRKRTSQLLVGVAAVL